MHFPVVHLIAALLFVESALAQPEKHSPRSPSGSITIPLFKRSSGLNESGTANMQSIKTSLEFSGRKVVNAMSNYARNTGTPTNHTGTTLSPRSSSNTATEPLVDHGGSFWYGQIEIGNPPQTLQMIFDTGSSDVWATSTLCNSTSCNGHTLYNPSGSNTAIDLNKTTNLTYGSGGYVFVEQYSDTVSVAGMIACNQTLGAVLMDTDAFNTTNLPTVSGLVGMGYQSVSAYNASPFFQTLVAQGQVSQAQFSFFLADNESTLILGGTDSTRYKGNFTYLPVTHQSYWETTLDTVLLGGNSVPFSDHRVIMDTGTTLIVGNKSNVDAVYAQIPGSGPIDPKLGPEGLYTFPCNTSVDLSFTFSCNNFPVPSDVFNLGTVDNTTNTTCLGALAWSPVLLEYNFTSWIMGDFFLRNYYSLFDLDNNRIGLAELN